MIKQNTPDLASQSSLSRRNFLRSTAGTAVAAGLVASAASCKKHSDDQVGQLKLGSGDLALFNVAYAFEQLERAFYEKMREGFFENVTTYEKDLLNSMYAMELAHCKLFEQVLGTAGLQQLDFDFSGIAFVNRNVVLNAARTIENTGVAFYNGAAWRYQNVEYMAVTGKIASVEARHAAVINNFISFGNFSDTAYVDFSTGMERSITPSQALSFINTYSVQKFSIDAI